MPIKYKNDIAWPPKEFDTYFSALDVYNGWHVGNPLKNIHAPVSHPSQLNGGIVGAASRAFFGKPQVGAERRTQLHVPLPVDVANLSADYVLGEMPRVVNPGFKSSEGGTESRDEIQDIIEKMINTAEVHATLLEAGTMQAALGGVFLRLIWDKDSLENVKLDVVHADNAIPEFRFKELFAVTFWSELSGADNEVWRHLERHEFGRIEHALFCGTATQLGTRMPVNAHPATEWLADVLDAESSIATGLDNRLTAEYFPNMRPNAIWRKKAHLAQLGASDFTNVTGLFEQVDEAWTSWMRDLRLAKARIIVPAAYLENNGMGNGASFDIDREIYESVNALTTPTGEPVPITPQQFDIRFEAHEATIKALTNKVLETAGWSPGSLGGSEVGMRTATEVQSDEQLSQRTRDKKLNYWRRLSHFYHTMLMLNGSIYGTKVPEKAPEVNFPSETQVNVEAMARTTQMLHAGQSASTETRVRMMNPDRDGTWVNKEVERIKEENGLGNAADPLTLTGLEDEEPKTPIERVQERIEKGD